VRAYGDRHQVPGADGAARPGVPGSQALKEALDALDAYAARGPTHPWFVRVGWPPDGGAVYLDLGTPDWSAVEVTAAGGASCPGPRSASRARPGCARCPSRRAAGASAGWSGCSASGPARRGS
jgi:hypothetical protein